VSAGAGFTWVRGQLERPLVANSTALVALRATNLIARLILMFAIAHAVPPAAFGLVVLALSLGEIGKVVADFGMDTLAIREYAVDLEPGAHERFASALAAAKVVFGAITYIGLAVWFAWKGPGEMAELGIIIGATALTALLINFALDWYQARLRIARVFIPVMLSNVLLAVAALLLVPRLHDLRLQAALFPAFELVNGLVLLIWLRREGLMAAPHFAFDRIPALARASLPIAVTGFIIMLYSRLDVLVLSSRLDPAAVGHYGMAFRFTEPIQLAAAAFALSVFSRFSAWFRDPAMHSLRRAAYRYLGATLAYGVISALALGLLAPPVIRRFFPEYVPAIPVLRVLAAALVFRSLNATLAGIIQGAGRFRLLTGIALWNLAVVFALLNVLVHRYQAPGAALALVLAEGLNSSIQIAFVARILSRHERSAVRVG
jgi:O-antigen/teichoic acid export membrane protein